jgi:hypothetical protein
VGARVSGCWGEHLRRGAPPEDEAGRTVSCARRRLPRKALIKLDVGLGLFAEVPVWLALARAYRSRRAVRVPQR